MMNKFNSEVTGKSGGTRVLMTGLAPNKVLAINPNEEKLKEIIGDNATKFDTDYKIHKSNLEEGLDVRTLNIWLQDKDEKASPTVLSIDLGESVPTSQNGNKQFINSKFQTTWASDLESLKANPKMEWFWSHDGIREARYGEIDYYKFLATYMRFDFRSEVSFLEYCDKNGIGFDKVYKEGDFSSLQELVEWGNTDEGEKEPWYITQLWTVKQTDNGPRQEVLSKSDTWFRCSQDKVTSYEVNLLKKREQERKESGYNLTNRLYTYNFQEFVEEECINGAPQQPAVGIESVDSSEEDMSWLN